MSLINNSYFNSERIIPNLIYPEMQADLNSLILIREPEYLKAALGYELFTVLMAGLSQPTVDQRYTDLLLGKDFTNTSGALQRWVGFAPTSELVSPIADYVYYYWLKNKHTQVMAVGTIQAENQNSKAVSPRHKAVDAWNGMVKKTEGLYSFMISNSDIYPEFLRHSYSWDIINLTTKINPLF